MQVGNTIINGMAKQKIKVNGLIWTYGKNCTNLAIALEGDETLIEGEVNKLTMVLMPSRWCTTPDEIKPRLICDYPDLTVDEPLPEM